MVDGMPMIRDEEARGKVRTVYHDIKRTLGTPAVPEMFQALAACQPPALELVWCEAKSLIGTRAFESLADRIRAHAVACARRYFFVPDHTEMLAARGVGEGEIRQLRTVVEHCHDTTSRLLLIASATEGALRSNAVLALSRVAAPLPSGAPKIDFPLRPVPTDDRASSEVLEEAREVLGVRFPPLALRLLANWPGYLNPVWGDIRCQVRSFQFRRRVSEIAEIAACGSHELAGAETKAGTPAQGTTVVGADGVSRAVDVLRYFTHHTPALLLTMSLFRVGLNAVDESALLELEAGA